MEPGRVELPSATVVPVLLRAQSRWRVLGFPALCDTSGNTAQPLLAVPHTPVAGVIGESPSRRQDPDRRRSGLTALDTRSGGEFERGLRLIGSYWFPWAGLRDQSRLLGTLHPVRHRNVETGRPPIEL